MSLRARNFVALAAGLLMAATASAVPFEYVRIGDFDGFGWGNGAGLTAANGGPCNIDGAGFLNAGDYLPDMNGNGSTATGSGDDWDNRSAAEFGGAFVTAVGASDAGGTTGSEYTDVTISNSYSQDPGTWPGFVFDFYVEGTDIAVGTDVYVNTMFADYDVTPAKITYTRADGTSFDAPLTAQGSGDDGLIQVAFATIPFSDVFTAEGTGYRASLRVDYVAPNEPYLAFNFAEVSVDPIPEPTSLTLLALGALGLLRRR